MSVALVLGGAAVVTGCKSVNPQTGVKEYDPVKTDQVVAALEPIGASAIRRVLKNSPEHSDEIAGYMRSVGMVFYRMESTGEFDPAYVIAELDQIGSPYIPEDLDYVVDIKNALLALYKINYGDRFRAELPPDQWPRQVARLICSSINDGLKDAGKPKIF